MSLRVGLDSSEADLDVQGEIDFDFFEETECSSSVNKTVSSPSSTSAPKSEAKELLNRDKLLLCDPENNLKDCNLNKTNIPESYSSHFKKPLITVSCDDATGLIQKTTIETVIPTPYNYKDNKCGKSSPIGSRKGKRILSPRLKSKVFNDDHEISDDSSLSSMSESESESEMSNVSDGSFELDEETDSMTDVSPLNSPYKCGSPMPSGVNLLREKATPDIQKECKKEGVKFPDNLQKKKCEKCDAIDIHELLKAVNRLEIGQNINKVCREKPSTPSVITQNMKCRKNLSFSNEEVRRIDNDNQVLLKKIMAQQNRPKSRPNSSMRVPSSSAVNRLKQQRQIELENLVSLCSGNLGMGVHVHISKVASNLFLPSYQLGHCPYCYPLSTPFFKVIPDLKFLNRKLVGGESSIGY